VLEIAQLVEVMISSLATTTIWVKKLIKALKRNGPGARTACVCTTDPMLASLCALLPRAIMMALRAITISLLTVVPLRLPPLHLQPLQFPQLSNKTNGPGATNARTSSSLELVEANVLLEVLMKAKRATTTLLLTLAIQATRLKRTGAGVINATFYASVALELEIAQLEEVTISSLATTTMLARKLIKALKRNGPGARTACVCTTDPMLASLSALLPRAITMALRATTISWLMLKSLRNAFIRRDDACIVQIACILSC